MEPNAEISVKLLSSGRYTWNITLKFDSVIFKDNIQILKQIDGELKEQFTDHVSRGSGRTGFINEDD